MLTTDAIPTFMIPGKKDCSIILDTIRVKQTLGQSWDQTERTKSMKQWPEGQESDVRFFDSKIEQNKEQKLAVSSIVK